MSLGETVTYCVLKAVSYVGASSCRPSALPFGGRSGFDVDGRHHLGRRCGGDGVARG